MCHNVHVVLFLAWWLTVVCSAVTCDTVCDVGLCQWHGWCQSNLQYAWGDPFTAVPSGTSKSSVPDVFSFSSQDGFNSASGGESISNFGVQRPTFVSSSSTGSYAGANSTAQISSSGEQTTGSPFLTHQPLSGQGVTTQSLPPQKKKEVFEQRGMWADTLSTGLVDLNIKGRKCPTRPLRVRCFLAASLTDIHMMHHLALCHHSNE